MAKRIFRELSAPVNVQWEVTPGCNYCCLHCYNYWREKETKKPIKAIEPSLRLLKKVIDEIISNSILAVIITGGEPLLVLDKISPYLSRLRDADVRMSLNTNASLITPTIMKKIIDLGITGLLVSLPTTNKLVNDEITQYPNSAERTINGIKIAIAHGITPEVNMVISQKNLPHIIESAKFLKSIGIKHIGISKAALPHNSLGFKKQTLNTELLTEMISKIVTAQKDLDMEVSSLVPLPDCFPYDKSIIDPPTKGYCLAGKTTCVIGYDGEIRACLHIPKSYGSIFDGLKNAWVNMSDWRTDKWIPTKCKKCSHQEVCFGGCKAEVLAYGGKMNDPDPFADFSNISRKHKHSSLMVKVSSSDIFRVSSHLYGRPEKFGGIFAITSSHVPVNNKLYKFIASRFNDQNTFMLNDLSRYLGISLIDAKKTITYLLNSHIIKQ